MYRVLLSRRAHKFMGKLPPAHRRRLKEIMDQMTVNPYSHPRRKMKGEENLYRIRIGAYRILFEVHPDVQQVNIIKIDKRSRIYR